MKAVFWILLGASVLAAGASPASAATDSALCQAAITTTEAAARLPAQMLDAIGNVETGRPVGPGGAIAPWPWSINVAGASHLYATAAEAIAAVRAAQAEGVQSIDVGCMQINLQHHPAAFATLEEAFDPAANVRYAAAFLHALHRGTGSWAGAVAAYHSSTPAIGAAYLARVAGVWRFAAVYGVVAPEILPAGQPVRPAPAEVVDPYHVLTPAFRAQLVSDLAFKRHRDAALGVRPGGVTTTTIAAAERPRPPHRGRGRPAPPEQGAARPPGLAPAAPVAMATYNAKWTVSSARSSE